MGPALGHESYVALKTESPWGTKNITAMEYGEFISESVQPTIEERIVQDLNNSRIRTKRIQGAKLVGGDLVWSVNVEDLTGRILKNVLPNEAFTDDGVGNGGQHVFTPGEESVMPPGLTYQVSKGGFVRDCFGGRVPTLALAYSAGEILQATAGLSFKDEEAGTPQTPTYTDQNPLMYHTGTVEIDGASAVVISANLAIDTGLKVDRRQLASNLILQQLTGTYVITGDFTMYVDDLTMINKFLNGTAAKLLIDLTGPVVGTTTRRLRLTLPTIFLNGAMPVVPGMDEITVTFPFVAIKTGAGTPDELIEMALFNSLRSAY